MRCLRCEGSGKRKAKAESSPRGQWKHKANAVSYRHRAGEGPCSRDRLPDRLKCIAGLRSKQCGVSQLERQSTSLHVPLFVRRRYAKREGRKREREEGISNHRQLTCSTLEGAPADLRADLEREGETV